MALYTQEQTDVLQGLMDQIRERFIEMACGDKRQQSFELSDKFMELFNSTFGKYEERVEGFKKLLADYSA